MKKIQFILAMGLLLLGMGHPLWAQSKAEKILAQNTLVKELVEGKHFVIDVNRANPMSAETVFLTSSYNLEIRGDSIISYLPYFGQAYSVPYGGGNGLIFTGTATNYEVKYTKKGEARVHFRVKTNEDSYTFNLQVYSNRSATINVMPVNRQSISFYGEVTSPKESPKSRPW